MSYLGNVEAYLGDMEAYLGDLKPTMLKILIC
jgi:hypothetical protein